MILKGYLFGILYALICLCIGFAMYKLGVPKHLTRKIVHILVGFEWGILYHFFGASIHFLVVCLLFLVLLTLAHVKKLMPMIESDGDNSPGTVYYAAAMSIMALITLFVPDMIIPFGIGVFCTSIGDGLAGVIGQSVRLSANKKIFGKKTLFGSLTNFIVCSLSVGIINIIFNLGMNIWHILAIALFATELELFCGRGLDNIAVTVGASLLSYLFVFYPTVENYIVPILLTPAIIAFSYKKRALTTGGIAAALALDIVVSATLKNAGFVILLSFLVGGVVVDRIKKKYKKTGQNGNIEQRGDCRDQVQVLANGGVAAICSVLYLYTQNPLFTVAYAASLAEAFADTAASGIGVLSGRSYDPFRRKVCQVGVSGGMSALGTLASLGAAVLIALLSLAFGLITPAAALVVSLSAFLGAIFDSMLGSLAQVKYHCSVCGAITERREHCDAPAIRHSGLPFVTNDVVNLLGTMFAASFAAFICFAIGIC